MFLGGGGGGGACVGGGGRGEEGAPKIFKFTV